MVIQGLQKLTLLDYPGKVACTIFTAGCNFRCPFCHNDLLVNMQDNAFYDESEIFEHLEKRKNVIDGVAVTGGEPLLQPEFAYEVFKLCHENGINTCLDTSGSILNDRIKRLLTETDRVLLDIKYTDDDLYRENVGCSLEKPLDFLYYLNEQRIPVTLRQVIIPTLNDNVENIEKLNGIIKNHSCIDKVELLPFKKICQTKYDSMNIEFPFVHIDTPSKKIMDKLNNLLSLPR